MRTMDRANSALEQLQSVLGDTRQPRLSDERFDQAHEVFESSSNQQGLILKWLKDFAAQRVGAELFSLMSIGCGSGILDNPLLEFLSGSEGCIRYTALDPNPVACSRFREDFEALGLANVRLDVRQESVESISCDQKFDIIHAVHSLYYFADPAASLEQLLGRLNTDGKLLVFQAPKGELNRLADCFWFHHEDVDIWFSERLEKHLQQMELAYAKTRIHGRVDVSRCFEAECPQGEMILDFITQVNCRTLRPASRQQLLDCLAAIAERNGEQVLIPHPVDAFVIAARS